MSASKSHDPGAAEGTNANDEPRQLEGSGSGAASALERMKAEHALRHKRQHGARGHGPEQQDDPAPVH
jgi:hypothetical protein